MGGLKIVVEHDTETRVCRSEDEDEHHQQDVGDDQCCECILVRRVDVIPGGNGSVEDEPNNCGRSATTVRTAVMENFR